MLKLRLDIKNQKGVQHETKGKEKDTKIYSTAGYGGNSSDSTGDFCTDK